MRGRRREPATRLTYSEKLKDVRRQRKRLEKLGEAEWICERCLAEDNRTLHVHHNYYLKGREPWDYDEGQLTVLCVDCHKEVEALHAELQEALSRISHRDLAFLIGTVNCANIVNGNLMETIPCRSWEEAVAICSSEAFGRQLCVPELVDLAAKSGGKLFVSALQDLCDKARIAS